ncbi:MAG: hypothetical protein IKN59_01840 [Paludibacteraceae bacterium]|nr:hypothetical protein [Paludibacteraceae bacterium]
MADNNILIKITSEADLSEAQKQLAALTKQSEELNAEMANSQTAYEKEVAAIKKLKLPREQEEEQLRRMKQEFRQTNLERKAQIKETNKSIKALSDQVKAYKTLNGESGKAVQQLRAMRERLMEMEDAGEFGTKAFIDLSIAAGQLEDKIGDTQQRIRILASDTKNMDALLGLGDGLAGSFYIATSAAEVFGEDLEGLQKAFYKVQAAMSILSGVQQVYNALQKDSAARVVISTAVERLAAKSKDKETAALGRNTKAWVANGVATTGSTIKTIAHTAVTKAATVAQAALNAVIYANPFVLLAAAIATATAAIVAFVKWNSDGAQAARAFNKATKEYEQEHTKTAATEAKRNYDRQQQIQATNNAEEKALADAKRRNASETEIAQIKIKYAKQRADDTRKFANEEIRINNKEIESLQEIRDAALKEANSYRDGSKKKMEALEKLTEAQNNYYNALQRGKDLEQERLEADRALAEAEQDLADSRKQLAEQLAQTRVDIMREGQKKEIAQIKLTYKEQLKEAGKGSDLYNALIQKRDKEIAEVEYKYKQQAQQAQLDLMRDGQAKEIAQINLNYEERLRTIQGDSEEELALRKAIIEKRNQEIADIERKYAIQQAKTLTEIDVAAAEEATKALKGNEGIEAQLKVWDNYYSARKYQIEENARLEEEEVQRSTDSEEAKTARIEQIHQRLQADLTALTKEGNSKRIEINEQYVSELELEAEKAADAAERAQGGGRLSALKANLDAQLALYDAQGSHLEAKWQAGVISWQDYQNQKWQITKATIDAEVEYQQNALQTVADSFQTAMGYMQQISDLAFEALNSNVQAELDALEKGYTTDWQEAQKSADKKYITEKEYEKKKAALEEKQAKYAKAQALTNIAIQTALAVMNAMATAPWPLNIAMAALSGAMGVAQLAVAASKPLAQYEKGRKGGKGEYAIIGEKGAELMYVPQGASIVPHDKIDKPATWGAYGVPTLQIPDLPSLTGDAAKYAATASDTRLVIDYDKLGEAFARKMPKQKAVTVNVDRSGVHVQEGRNVRSYLNAKYMGAWN